MADIKVSSEIISEINAIKDASGELVGTNSGMNSSDISNLPTAQKYVNQQDDIYDLLVIYNELVKKDCRDFSSMAEEFMETDRKISGK